MMSKTDPQSGRPGFAFPLMLLGAFRAVIDELQEDLAHRGYSNMRPSYGFALQAIGTQGATAVDVGRRLDMSKQAAGKTIDKLVEDGYVARASDPGDRRRKTVTLTARGVDVLTESACSFGRVRRRWIAVLGDAEFQALESGLQAISGESAGALDLTGWL
ncbi:MarR family winged helix-turn-helix transcriptional regulator [Paenarthrobacter sp. PH39-S1]|uniref:MarR family winged helix-turn-helix transcriptional regulator n=1 Tax=Paenarthrobacter sp. PH39-S1 TaxID=3046204 RepID=UPI0024BA74AD|nr:MarR family winged helix-turn-helix transcriptional regulator [Paenarthrobacter sp. PH39-S1]MDJ0356303.1 MarR family winged helix-turn-helix transcriptional regulator [Paenarthrobacter sp. PH39-S1]